MKRSDMYYCKSHQLVVQRPEQKERAYFICQAHMWRSAWRTINPKELSGFVWEMLGLCIISALFFSNVSCILESFLSFIFNFWQCTRRWGWWRQSAPQIEPSLCFSSRRTSDTADTIAPWHPNTPIHLMVWNVGMSRRFQLFCWLPWNCIPFRKRSAVFYKAENMSVFNNSCFLLLQKLFLRFLGANAAPWPTVKASHSSEFTAIWI